MTFLAYKQRLMFTSREYLQVGCHINGVYMWYMYTGSMLICNIQFVVRAHFITVKGNVLTSKFTKAGPHVLP